jgi:NTP pyrophosphatase (non-canonical NTP hydrolase)
MERKKSMIMKKRNQRKHSKDLNSNMTIDLNKYVEFVNTTTSKPSKEFPEFADRLNDLKIQGFPTERLLTAAVGMSAEAGEFTEIVKKIVFQGKPVNEENLFHLKRELGDIMWYVSQACLGLDISIEEVIQMNFEKLSARYPEGAFSIERSENRKEGDL